jgi:transcriptional regulator with XRE-family HTH domain
VVGVFQNLGRTLIRLRERAGKSQTALARAASVGKSQLSKYENGKELPKLESLERVLVALGIGYFEFFRAMDIVDREEPGVPQLTREEIDECFTRLTWGMFALHREIVTKLPDRR